MFIIASISLMFLIVHIESSPILPQPRNIVEPHQISDQTSEKDTNIKSWTDDRLCVLKMGSSCPSGFSENKIKLSVQTDVNPKDTDINGERLIIMGKAGETSLTRNTYDSLYTLTLATCCK